MLKLWYERTDDIENSRNEVLTCLDVISGFSQITNHATAAFAQLLTHRKL
jgi:hypothetical protein